MLLNISATKDVPINVADQYSHKLLKTPETSAGAKERAGFIEIHDINIKKKIPNPIIPLWQYPVLLAFKYR